MCTQSFGSPRCPAWFGPARLEEPGLCGDGPAGSTTKENTRKHQKETKTRARNYSFGLNAVKTFTVVGGRKRLLQWKTFKIALTQDPYFAIFQSFLFTSEEKKMGIIIKKAHLYSTFLYKGRTCNCDWYRGLTGVGREALALPNRWVQNKKPI